MWQWIGITAAAAAVLAVLRWMTGVGLAGDLMAFSGCVLGILIMVQSQVGFVSSHVAPDEDEDELPQQTETAASQAAIKQV
jgi:hypothetical protein